MSARRLAGVMGWPVAHSRSPALHRFWLNQYKIDGDYRALAVAPDQLPTALHALAGKGFAGCNLTVPLKEAAVGLMDRLDPTARRIGAVNTVAVGPDDELEGLNSDGFGFIENLRQAQPDFDLKRGPVVVLGAGGAARAIVDALRQAGSPEIRLANRSDSHAEELAAMLGATVGIVPWQKRAAALEGAILLVNTTSLGMAGQPPLDLDLAALPKNAVVNDIVYAPLETVLLKNAKAHGSPTVDGLGMLLHQGRLGFSRWFGIMPEVTPELRAAVLVAAP
ncbi:MAG TPA: shikimate dehydrogenase [Stellaceae bacterium]|jgi:shikimate dehydrogenase|nr:shikimate dehydrogenase [Stellaceae bacterium]